jgi:hypothetical protein
LSEVREDLGEEIDVDSRADEPFDEAGERPHEAVEVEPLVRGWLRAVGRCPRFVQTRRSTGFRCSSNAHSSTGRSGL